jgi:hypothetical protein
MAKANQEEKHGRSLMVSREDWLPWQPFLLIVARLRDGVYSRGGITSMYTSRTALLNPSVPAICHQSVLVCSIPHTSPWWRLVWIYSGQSRLNNTFRGLCSIMICINIQPTLHYINSDLLCPNLSWQISTLTPRVLSDERTSWIW